MADPGVIRVLVIDDSALSRQALVTMLESDPGIRVVGRAVDGDDGLRQTLMLEPDVITLDLEMPRLGGFAFLRLLMLRRPTPVVVVSSHSGRENVFRALELGAVDFVAKPHGVAPAEGPGLKEDLIRKIRACSQLRAGVLTQRRRSIGMQEELGEDVLLLEKTLMPQRGEPVPSAQPLPLRVCAIGASTGGPPALQQILAALDPKLPLAVLIAQHMPATFTAAFAERLDAHSRFEVREAKGGEVLRPGLALVAPGWAHLCVECQGDAYVTRLERPQSDDRLVPSVDRLLETAASAVKEDLVAVVLTGMGGDGAVGVRAVHEQGGRVLAEAPETAVIFGMPQEAIATGVVDEVVPLYRMARAITRFARETQRGS